MVPPPETVPFKGKGTCHLFKADVGNCTRRKPTKDYPLEDRIMKVSGVSISLPKLLILEINVSDEMTGH